MVEDSSRSEDWEMEKASRCSGWMEAKAAAGEERPLTVESPKREASCVVGVPEGL